MIKAIEQDFKIQILDNKYNKDTFKKFNKNEIFLSNLTINSLGKMINYRYDKIKIVKGIKYHSNIIYEYKFLVENDKFVRIGFSIDYELRTIFIILVIEINEKIKKHIFDKLIHKCF